MANELQLAAGLKLTNPAPADAYYCKPQVGQAPAQPYASPAEACSFVAQPLRYQGMTVNVASIGEMHWLTSDLSDNGLMPKSAPGGGGGSGGGGGYSTAAYDFAVTQDGENTFQLPAGTTGLDFPALYQTPNPTPDGSPPIDGESNAIPAQHTAFDASTGILTVFDAAGLKAGQTVHGTRRYGGGAGGGPVQASDIQGVLSEDQLPELAIDELSQQIDDYKAQLGPFTLRSAPLVASPQNGAIEFDGTTIYATSNGVRKAL